LSKKIRQHFAHSEMLSYLDLYDEVVIVKDGMYGLFQLQEHPKKG